MTRHFTIRTSVFEIGEDGSLTNHGEFPTPAEAKLAVARFRRADRASKQEAAVKAFQANKGQDEKPSGTGAKGK